METILKIRRLHYKEGLSQRSIAIKLRMSRHTISKYLKQEFIEPPVYKRVLIHHPKLGDFLPELEHKLIEEYKLPEKQHLTAIRHFEWLRTLGYQGNYCAVASYIRKFKEAYQPEQLAVFIPQTFPVGESYQFDWSTETVKLNGQLIKVSIAHFRLCYSRAFFIRGYYNQKLDMLIDAHNQAFDYFGGVPKRGIYDNMRTAVKAIGPGKERVFNERFLTMMNHFLVEPVACTPASGWEKGQVERQVKTLRKRLFIPTLSFHSMEELNPYLLEQCQRLIQNSKHPEDNSKSIATCFAMEQNTLSPYEPYKGYHFEFLRVNSLSLCQYDAHKYSVPCHLVGKIITLQATATDIRIIFDNDCVAEHKRSYRKGEATYHPLHYLSALKQKPGALRNGEPFVNWKLPEPILRIQSCLLKQPKGDRAMVQLLILIADHGEDLGVTAAEIALEEGMPTVEAILNIINRLTEPVIPNFSLKEIPLALPPEGNCERYNSLLKEVDHANATA